MTTIVGAAYGRLVFVCKGNICRSPLAEAFARMRLRELGHDAVDVYSGALFDWHAGKPADPRALAHAHRLGYDLQQFRASAVDVAALTSTDLVVALDRSILDELRARIAERGHDVTVELFGERTGRPVEVSDPFRNNDHQFSAAALLIRRLTTELVDELSSTGALS